MKTIFAGLTVAFIIVTLVSFSSAATKPSFVANLNGKQQVPAVKTKAHGKATFSLNKDKSELHYKLTVQNIENVNMAHLHLAPKGKNGEVVVWLYPAPSTPQPKLIEKKFSGTLAEGTIKAADLTGPLAGKSLSDLLAQIKAGAIYLNVHTQQHPQGEIRGQVH